METLDAANIGLGKEELMSFELIKGSEISSNFDLELQIGKTDSDNKFERYPKEKSFDVGTMVTVKMISLSETEYK